MAKASWHETRKHIEPRQLQGTQMQARSFHVLPNLVLLSIGKLVFV
jgi:hypothetical protein